MPSSANWRSASLALALATAASTVEVATSDPAPIQGIQRIEQAAQPEGRGQNDSDHFLLEWKSAAPHPAQTYRGQQGLERAAREGAVGLISFRRRQVENDWQLEQDILFPFEGVRIMAVECLSESSPRLVWREISGAGGRTIFAEWTAKNERLKSVEWGVDGTLREYISTSRGAVMPQYLLDLIRRGQVVAGRFEVFDPCTGKLEPWQVKLSYRQRVAAEEQAGAEPQYLRRLEFRREDGTLAGRYDFDGARLESFQWQEGALRARRISSAEYDDRRELWGLDETSATPQLATRGVKAL